MKFCVKLWQSSMPRLMMITLGKQVGSSHSSNSFLHTLVFASPRVLPHLLYYGTAFYCTSRQDHHNGEAMSSATVCIEHLEKLRSEDKFDCSNKSVVESTKELTDPPCLPRYCHPARKPGDSSASGRRFSSTEDFYHKLYFEAIDVLTGELTRCF